MREGRLSRRMGFTRHLDPVKVDGALVRLIPKEDWTLVSHLLIVYGRKRSNACTEKRKSCAPNGAFERSFAGQAKGHVSLPVRKQKGRNLLPQSFASNLQTSLSPAFVYYFVTLIRRKFLSSFGPRVTVKTFRLQLAGRSV